MESRRRRSRSQLLKWGCYVLALFVCAALQTTPGLFQLGEAKPLLVLPLCLAVAVFEGEFAGALLAFWLVQRIHDGFRIDNGVV